MPTRRATPPHEAPGILQLFPAAADCTGPWVACHAPSSVLAQASKAPLDSQAFDCFEIPVDPESRRRARQGVALVDRHSLRGDIVELRDIFEPARVGNGAA